MVLTTPLNAGWALTGSRGQIVALQKRSAQSRHSLITASRLIPCLANGKPGSGNMQVQIFTEQTGAVGPHRDQHVSYPALEETSGCLPRRVLSCHLNPGEDLGFMLVRLDQIDVVGEELVIGDPGLNAARIEGDLQAAGVRLPDGGYCRGCRE